MTINLIKKIFLFNSLLLLSLPIFATSNSEFSALPIKEVFKRGLAIRATVIQSPGIKISGSHPVFNTNGNACMIALRTKIGVDGILKKGREVLFTKENHLIGYDGGLKSVDPVVSFIGFNLESSTAAEDASINDLNHSCLGLVKFDTVEHSGLIEL